MARGTQPPPATFGRFATRNAKSTQPRGTTTARAETRDQCQACRSTAKKRSDVIMKVLVTAIP